jgi:hypothetical protein
MMNIHAVAPVSHFGEGVPLILVVEWAQGSPDRASGGADDLYHTESTGLTEFVRGRLRWLSILPIHQKRGSSSIQVQAGQKGFVADLVAPA